MVTEDVKITGFYGYFGHIICQMFTPMTLQAGKQ